jgi:poly(3-hydroxybutyrate) depolymerase
MRDGSTAISAPGRQVLLFLPAQPADAPVLFFYHGAGDNAVSFANNFGARTIAQTFGAVVVVPVASGNFSIEWPILKDDDPSGDLTLFDDVIGCLEQRHDIDEARVYTAGFSAGALWSTRLLSERADHLAAATIFSGGIQERLGLFTFNDPAWPLPVMCTHGGPTDEVLVNFKVATEKLIARLTAIGSLSVLCIHNQGHTVTEDHYVAALNFLFAHRFGEPSPFAGGLNSDWPSSCALTPAP